MRDGDEISTDAALPSLQALEQAAALVHAVDAADAAILLAPALRARGRRGLGQA